MNGNTRNFAWFIRSVLRIHRKLLYRRQRVLSIQHPARNVCLINLRAPLISGHKLAQAGSRCAGVGSTQMKNFEGTKRFGAVLRFSTLREIPELCSALLEDLSLKICPSLRQN